MYTSICHNPSTLQKKDLSTIPLKYLVLVHDPSWSTIMGLPFCSPTLERTLPDVNQVYNQRK